MCNKCIVSVSQVLQTHPLLLRLEVRLNGKQTVMEVDTGTSASIIGEQGFYNTVKDFNLCNNDQCFLIYTVIYAGTALDGNFTGKYVAPASADDIIRIPSSALPATCLELAILFKMAVKLSILLLASSINHVMSDVNPFSCASIVLCRECVLVHRQYWKSQLFNMPSSYFFQSWQGRQTQRGGA